MSRELASIRSAAGGASFVRADLHIHSFGTGGSYDVSDPTMTPEAIVATASSKGLGVIAITDHNAIGNVERALAAAAGTGLLVIPGVELSTPGGHFLGYTEDFASLQRFFARLELSPDARACRTSAHDVLRLLGDMGGVAIAAHIDLDNGFERTISGYGDPKGSVVASRTLVALEVARVPALAWYSERDDDVERRRLLRERIDALNDPFITLLPKIQSSDAHKLSSLGKNYDQRDKLTRLKLQRLDWSSFRRAFLDPEARVRVEEEIPQAIPRFVGLHLTGGFLDGQTFSFSPNLTCIIGGRGSGKSTAFQALRCAAGRPPPEDLRTSDAWPEQIDALFRDEFGAEFHLRVDAFGEVTNCGSPSEPPPLIQVESLAQGEMARTIERCGQDPAALLAFLDELAPVAEAKQIAARQRRELAENGGKIAGLEREVAQLDTVQRTLKAKQAQERLARQEKGHEVVDQQTKLTAAMNLRSRLVPALDAVFVALNAALTQDVLDDFRELVRIADQNIGSAGSSPLPGVLDALEKQLTAARSGFEAMKGDARRTVSTFALTCQRAQETLQTELTKKVQELRDRGIPLDLKSLTALTSDIQTLLQREVTLKRQQKDLEALRTERVRLREQYRSAQKEAYRRRLALAAEVGAQLRETLVDMQITLQFLEGRLSPKIEEKLKEVMDWRTAAVPKAAALVRAMGALELVDAVLAGNAAALASAKTDDLPVISAGEAAAVVDRFKHPLHRRSLEEADFDDSPRMTISRALTDASGIPLVDPKTGKARYLVRDFAELSLGQQQAVVLGMLLCSSSRTPLLIDQPEDNLDSAFVFRVLVRALRRIKERRQVILVTHNANIGVLSDSDMIVPLKATAERGLVRSPGSVEVEETRELVCEILEGGRSAYDRRGTLYGRA
ncbi:MAG: TrlF family AAA-like ATPase [Polyangiaceae bacterium]